MEEQFQYSPTPLKHKLKHTLICGCFKHHPTHYDQLPDESSPTSHHHNRQGLTRTSSTGGSGGAMEATIRSCKSEEFNLKDKCRSLISRMGSTSTPRSGQHHHHHRKSRSTDFRYDPMSYALNFEDDHADVDEHFPFRNFSSRLPTSPRAAPFRSISDGVVNHTSSSSSDQPAPSTSVNDPPPREITAYT